MPFGRRKELPSHLWTQCPDCGEMLFNKQLTRNMNVCMKCDHHFKIGARERVDLLVDKGTFEEHDAEIVSADPLGFVDSKPYTQRIEAARLKSGARDAVITGTARISREPVEIAVMDFEFIGGSMGSVVGEKLSRACEAAVNREVPLVAVTASGGARMQEGILSLMQLPKTVCAIEDLRDARCGFISVMTHPTTAGVLASFASLGDVIVAEPGALLAFTGPRVVQQTTREKLPDDFGLAESNLRYGHLDAIVPRGELRSFLGRALRLFTNAR
jgi:acetyl-CoA carboxylase carboxyl transferase subunit beta